jgi:hypothetical protein
MIGALEAMQHNLNEALAAKKELLLNDPAIPLNKKIAL